MDSLSEKNPGEFWKLFDKLNDLDKQHKTNPIPAVEWFEHFSKLMTAAQDNHTTELTQEMDRAISENAGAVFNDLDFIITLPEIHSAMSKLKLGKSPGIDQIPNEMLKAGQSILSPVIHKLCNLIYSNSTFPDVWRTSMLMPLHKKGDTHNPQNYRGISLSSNLCKLFCTVIHTRLAKFLKDNNLIPNNQIGFQKLSRTADHVLTLKTLIDKYLNKLSKERLYVCFVDFRSAFDTISRRALFYKMSLAGIGGHFLKSLQDMYQQVDYCVKLSLYSWG